MLFNYCKVSGYFVSDEEGKFIMLQTELNKHTFNLDIRLTEEQLKEISFNKPVVVEGRLIKVKSKMLLSCLKINYEE